MTIRNNSSGMSLLQVVIAMGLSFLIGSFVLQMMLQAKKAELMMAQNSEIADAELTIQRILLSPVGCIHTLYKKLPIEDKSFPVSLDGIYTDNMDPDDPSKDAPIIPVGKKYDNGKLVLGSIRLLRNKPDETPTPLPKNAFVRVYMEFQFFKPDANGNIDVVNGDRSTRRIPIGAQVDDNGYIKGCSSLDQFEIVDKICQDLGGAITDPLTKKCSLLHSKVLVNGVCDALGLQSNGTNCY